LWIRRENTEHLVRYSGGGAIMHAIGERQRNQAAFRQLRSVIQQTYPPGRFLAIGGGKIIADAATFGELDSALQSQGQDSADVLVVQAGVEYPESAVIFI
jgi:hypothetical protein